MWLFGLPADLRCVLHGAGYVPQELKLLARKTARAFYIPTCAVVVDLLTRHAACLKEDDIREALQLPPRDVRDALSRLKGDRIVSSGEYIDPLVNIDERKNRKARYWFLDYQAVCIKALASVHSNSHDENQIQKEEKDGINSGGAAAESTSLSSVPLPASYLHSSCFLW